MNLEEEFSDLSPEERTVRCLELAQLALARVDKSANEEMKQVNLNVARCWHSLARQFSTIKSLQARVAGDGMAAQPSQLMLGIGGAESDSEVNPFFDSFAPAGV